MANQINDKANFKMNSQDYWDARFKTDWNDFGGDQQTAFFAETLNAMLPDWIIHETNENAYSVCDLGCAEGDALKIYKQVFMTSQISGEDFSKHAIDVAKKRYPEFEFRVSDILEPEGQTKFPIVICSNVIEHFKDTYKVISSICERSTKYAIIMFPYREPEAKISEHEHSFHTSNIPIIVDDNYLVYAKSTECNSIYYPYEQVLLIFAKDKKYARLSELTENISSDREKKLQIKSEEMQRHSEKLEEKLQEEIRRNTEQVYLNEKYQKKIEEYSEKALNASNTLEDCNEKIIAQKKELDEQKEKMEQLKILLEEVQGRFAECESRSIQLGNELAQERNAVDQREKRIAEQIKRLTHAERDLHMCRSLLRQKDEYLAQAQAMCDHFATAKLMRLNHFLYRIKGQLLKGTKESRKEFWSWLRGRIKKTNRTIGQGENYNPWMITKRKLQEAYCCRFVESSVSEQEGAEVFDALPSMCSDLSAEQKSIISQNYTKYDVIILSVIDYDFRHQRPQHFATRFAANGHRTYYVNANFVRTDSIISEDTNLYIVDFSCNEHNAIYTMQGRDNLDWMREKLTGLIDAQAIRDAIVIVDYPNWVYGAEYIRERYGFKIVTDYMDDYTGFLGTAEEFLKENCIRLLETCDLVVASSQFLYDVAASHTEAGKIKIVRNGTEVDHFYQAVRMEKRDKKRKTIGYYGAVSHWFAWEKVCAVARHFPMCDIVIVGDVTEYRDKLEKYDNIKLLGEKPYKELPQYLADFDVCLIPFDTSTDLIKATNPVKFYEYLSAGKKVVATEIPELAPYKDQYVYMSNNDAEFVHYVELCLNGEDSLCSMDECITFAKENDWQRRYEVFAEGCESMVPMISIIVLTYNGLDMNKTCIRSILEKTAYTKYELIIVDNASTDGTVEYLHNLDEMKIPNVKVILNENNVGFAGGNNIGIASAEGKYILLLNNDTVVSRGWLTGMVKHLENNPEFGMCNPVTNSIGNESMIGVRYNNETEMDQFAYGWTCTHMGEEYLDVDRLPLFSTLIRREVIDEVGVLDDSYKVGMFEDDDYTERVIRAGYKIVIADDAFVHHINNGSFKKLDNDKYRRIFEQNKALFEKKWGRKWTMPKYRAGVNAEINEDYGL